MGKLTVPNLFQNCINTTTKSETQKIGKIKSIFLEKKQKSPEVDETNDSGKENYDSGNSQIKGSKSIKRTVDKLPNKTNKILLEGVMGQQSLSYKNISITPRNTELKQNIKSIAATDITRIKHFDEIKLDEMDLKNCIQNFEKLYQATKLLSTTRKL